MSTSTEAKANGRLGGKVCLIAGGGGGMGGAVARLFAAEGASVVVADFREAAYQGVVDDIVAGGGIAVGARLDVTSLDQWQRVTADTEARFSKLTTMCYLAGANHRVSFDDLTEEMFRHVIDANLTGNFLGIKAVVPALRRNGGGCIINTGSLASLRPGNAPAYSASKFGVTALTGATARAYGPDGIRCCQVNPGHVDTPFIRDSAEHSPNDWSTSLDNPENYQRRLASVPLGRLQTAEDVATAFLYLASDEAAMVSGSAITVDGAAGV